MDRRVALAVVAALATGIPTPSHAQDVVRENVAFMSADGRSAVIYSTVRSDYTSYRLYLGRTETPEDFSYVYPPDFDLESGDNGPAMRFDQGDYATMQEVAWDDRVSVSEDGVYTLRTWGGNTRPDGHFGFWQTPSGFHHFVYAWVFPENLEVVSHESNREGRWITRGRTLTYFGEDLNDITFTLRFRPTTQGLYAALEEGLSGDSSVSVSQDGDGILLTLDEAVLFPSGSADLTEAGRAVLGQVGEALTSEEGLHVAIQGHTDNVPVRGALTETFATNWELSAARSLAVLHALMDRGVPEASLEVRAFAATVPVADNDSAEGRALNRRVELRIQRPGG